MHILYRSILLYGFCSALQPLPPVRWEADVHSTTFNTSSWLSNIEKNIYIDPDFAEIRDVEGLTLIPPSAHEFAETFRQDIQALFGYVWTLEKANGTNSSGVYLGPFRGNAKQQFMNDDGAPTEEGYELDISHDRVYIGAAGARGMWWGSRTFLQQLLVANGTTIASGRTLDAPAYATRGYMLDAGRKYYNPEFLKELCTYASFFKISEFHFHSSDNYPLNRGRNGTWSEAFSHFSLYPEQNTDLRGMILRQNETLSRTVFEDIQQHCAQRGITVVPEIEAPGHALAVTKWKPELALAKKDLLNLSHPDAIPTVKAIWSEFLPWFQTKEVHIGADEYDPDLADDYINFVNEMADFINITSGKRVRIWGTHEPSNTVTISRDIIVQHWQYGQSDPVQLQKEHYHLINSEDWWAYMSLKNDHMPILPAPYPQFYNTTRTLNFADRESWQWDPSLYNPVNTSQQVPIDAMENKGAILAAWNDNGPDATTQLEAYYAMREGIPLVAARAWSGARGVNVDVGQFAGSVALLASHAPGQNLERRNSTVSNSFSGSSILSWARQRTDSKQLNLNRGSFGPPYTLHINASSAFEIQGPDTNLKLSSVPQNATNNATGMFLVFTTSDNFQYPLRSVSSQDGHDARHPGRIWTNQSSSSHTPVPISLPTRLRIETDVVNGSRVWINDQFAGRFEVFVYGGRNALFSWSQMAFVAPLNTIEGGVEGILLQDGISDKRNEGGSNDVANPPVSSHGVSLSGIWMSICGSLVVAFVHALTL